MCATPTDGQTDGRPERLPRHSAAHFFAQFTSPPLSANSPPGRNHFSAARLRLAADQVRRWTRGPQGVAAGQKPLGRARWSAAAQGRCLEGRPGKCARWQLAARSSQFAARSLQPAASSHSGWQRAGLAQGPPPFGPRAARSSRVC